MYCLGWPYLLLSYKSGAQTPTVKRNTTWGLSVEQFIRTLSLFSVSVVKHRLIPDRRVLFDTIEKSVCDCRVFGKGVHHQSLSQTSVGMFSHYLTTNRNSFTYLFYGPHVSRQENRSVFFHWKMNLVKRTTWIKCIEILGLVTVFLLILYGRRFPYV